MIKTFNKPETERNFLNLIKGIYEKPTTNIILNGERLNIFTPKIRNKDKDFSFCHFYATLHWRFQPWKLGKKKKRHSCWKGKSKTICS